MDPEAKKLAEGRLFWVSLTIFGAMFSTGLFFIFEHVSVPGILCTAGGLMGLVFLVRDHFKKVPVRENVLILCAVLTWLAIGYDYYDRHHSDALPVGDLQTFDAGPCHGMKAETGPSHGLFTNFNNVYKRCEQLPTGRSVVIVQLLGGHNYSELMVRGVTPKDFVGNSIRLSIHWFAEYYPNPDLSKKIVDWRISHACGTVDLNFAAEMQDSAPLGGHVLTASELTLGVVCRPHEQYSFMLTRGGANDTLPALVNVSEVEVDMR
jgi:hypothetical protein